MTQTDISRNIQRLIELKGNLTRKDIERMTAAAGSRVTSTTLGNFLNQPEERSPWVKTIITLSQVLRVPAWMLMVKEFPLHKASSHPINSISEDGFLLLCAFEKAPPIVKYSILEAASHAIKDTDKASAIEIRETQAKYLS